MVKIDVSYGSSMRNDQTAYPVDPGNTVPLCALGEGSHGHGYHRHDVTGRQRIGRRSIPVRIRCRLDCRHGRQRGGPQRAEPAKPFLRLGPLLSLGFGSGLARPRTLGELTA